MVFAPAPPVRTCHALQTGLDDKESDCEKIFFLERSITGLYTVATLDIQNSFFLKKI